MKKNTGMFTKKNAKEMGKRGGNRTAKKLGSDGMRVLALKGLEARGLSPKELSPVDSGQ